MAAHAELADRLARLIQTIPDGAESHKDAAALLRELATASVDMGVRTLLSEHVGLLTPWVAALPASSPAYLLGLTLLRNAMAGVQPSRAAFLAALPASGLGSRTTLANLAALGDPNTLSSPAAANSSPLHPFHLYLQMLANAVADVDPELVCAAWPTLSSVLAGIVDAHDADGTARGLAALVATRILDSWPGALSEPEKRDNLDNLDKLQPPVADLDEPREPREPAGLDGPAWWSAFILRAARRAEAYHDTAYSMIAGLVAALAQHAVLPHVLAAAAADKSTTLTVLVMLDAHVHAVEGDPAAVARLVDLELARVLSSALVKDIAKFLIPFEMEQGGGAGESGGEVDGDDSSDDGLTGKVSLSVGDLDTAMALMRSRLLILCVVLAGDDPAVRDAAAESGLIHSLVQLLAAIRGAQDQSRKLRRRGRAAAAADPDPDGGSGSGGIPQGLLSDVLRGLGNIAYNHRANQDLIRETGGLQLILDSCMVDDRHPLSREWALAAIRNLIIDNEGNQAVVASLNAQGVASPEELDAMGIEADIDDTGKLRLRRARPQ